MLSLSLALCLAAAPPHRAPPPPLPTIAAPFGHFGGVVEPVPPGGVKGELTLAATFGQCPAQAISLERWLGGAMRALEQLQQWLAAAKLERRLYARPGTLARLLTRLGEARLEARHACAAPPLGEGFRLDGSAPPRTWCPAPAGRTTGDFWFFVGPRPAAVVSVQPGAAQPCRPRLSSVLYDERGTPRLLVHADWAGALEVTLLADRCQRVEFSLDPATQAFVPQVKSCKR